VEVLAEHGWVIPLGVLLIGQAVQTWVIVNVNRARLDALERSILEAKADSLRAHQRLDNLPFQLRRHAVET